MTAEDLILFVDDNLNGDYSRAIDLLRQQLPKAAGRPVSVSDDMRDCAYGEVYGLFNQVIVFQQADESLIYGHMTIIEACKMINRKYDFSINREGYYSWIKAQDPEMYPPCHKKLPKIKKPK